MTAIELMARLNGEVLGHKIRAVVGSETVVLARMVGTEWEYTPEGQELANTHSNQVVAESEAKVTRTRKAKDVPAEPVAVESADVEPEL